MKTRYGVHSLAVIILYIVWFSGICPMAVSAVETTPGLTTVEEGWKQSGHRSTMSQYNRAAQEQALRQLPTTGLLPITDTTNDRVMAFDPLTGNLIHSDFIPSDPAHLTSPIHAILSADGNSILVSDENRDVVQQYDLYGNYMGVFAPDGGADTQSGTTARGEGRLSMSSEGTMQKLRQR